MTILLVVSPVFEVCVRCLCTLVITFHFIRIDGSFVEEFTILKSSYFSLRKEERFI